MPQHFGFTPQLSTTHQLLRVVEHIHDGKNSNLATAAILLDIAKAFDKVWIEDTSLFLLKTQTLHQENFRQAYAKGEFWPLYGEACSLSADNDSAMGDIEPRTRPAVPGSSYEHCIEKEYKTYCAEYKAIETELEKLRAKRNWILICVELNCEIRNIESDVDDKMHDIEYNSPNRRKIAKARNLFNIPAKLIEISNKYEGLNSEEINETIEVNDNPDNGKQAAEEAEKVEKSKVPPLMLKYVKNYVDILDVIRSTCGPTENKFGNGYIKIFTIGIEQYQKVQSTLKEDGFDYYLIRPMDRRSLKVVIKDLPLYHDTDEIKKCLKKH
ncbi:hypothetical protein AVEN_24385-1 [Araneus ventricosus]|uniref:Reverse transcriptase domain-containing protein n=1 Tax=Araneus ventricosus TaxID=182803 RepID=A0A4Y2XAK1_ARAVE|nr:hypothetical protein AVEN_24385-1 [Araneus ventricosus]